MENNTKLICSKCGCIYKDTGYYVCNTCLDFHIQAKKAYWNIKVKNLDKFKHKNKPIWII